MRYDTAVSAKTADEYATFSKALKKVLKVSHEELQSRIECDKQERQQHRKQTSSDHASREKD